MNEAQTLLSMPGVGFFGMLVIGIIAGYIAEKVTASDHGLLTNLLVGIAGSFVGGTLANLMNVAFYGWLGNLIVASVGAILVLWIWKSIRGPAAPAS
ncbi:GlsB/YeaQ/YmgE family stress response membrane protein [Methyloceanibacter sp.]|uniref:GlsB/YeaQ/YmgE family stress response membrane protein n=1 Tax=Methyloceanibacter sp. TaxID=1965321 RepID=UPI002D4AC870|nr:GlsB/YeaQ/YmgE family stress response membrane protein [Methyloceanibacter sp.]HZP09989.1 GlsB/YeaQ/YmgE family stress response membrane protein [Methyloceanibacter sp.]